MIGLDDLGIYRISGLSSEIQKFRKAFEKSKLRVESDRELREARLYCLLIVTLAGSLGAKEWIKEADINVVTGVLKLYLRELPEALFTDRLYPPFIEGIGL